MDYYQQQFFKKNREIAEKDQKIAELEKDGRRSVRFVVGAFGIIGITFCITISKYTNEKSGAETKLKNFQNLMIKYALPKDNEINSPQMLSVKEWTVPDSIFQKIVPKPR